MDALLDSESFRDSIGSYSRDGLMPEGDLAERIIDYGKDDRPHDLQELVR